MRRVLFLSILFCLAAPSALAQDPVQVDPNHYSVMLDNEKVRVLKVRYNPKEKSVMHEHPAGVAAYLDDVRARFTLPDGSTTDGSGKAGEVKFTEAGKHLPENVGDAPFEVVLVELKGQPAATPTPVSLDPVTVDPAHHKVEFENDRVRVLRVTFKPHDKVKEHEHPDGVAIFLTDVRTRFTGAGGTTREGGGKRGEAVWAPAERHSLEAMSDKPAEVILVELKR